MAAERVFENLRLAIPELYEEIVETMRENGGELTKSAWSRFATRVRRVASAMKRDKERALGIAPSGGGGGGGGGDSRGGGSRGGGRRRRGGGGDDDGVMGDSEAFTKLRYDADDIMRATGIDVDEEEARLNDDDDDDNGGGSRRRRNNRGGGGGGGKRKRRPTTKKRRRRADDDDEEYREDGGDDDDFYDDDDDDNDEDDDDDELAADDAMADVSMAGVVSNSADAVFELAPLTRRIRALAAKAALRRVDGACVPLLDAAFALRLRGVLEATRDAAEHRQRRWTSPSARALFGALSRRIVDEPATRLRQFEARARAAEDKAARAARDAARRTEEEREERERQRTARAAQRRDVERDVLAAERRAAAAAARAEQRAKDLARLEAHERRAADEASRLAAAFLGATSTRRARSKAAAELAQRVATTQAEATRVERNLDALVKQYWTSATRGALAALEARDEAALSDAEQRELKDLRKREEAHRKLTTRRDELRIELQQLQSARDSVADAALVDDDASKAGAAAAAAAGAAEPIEVADAATPLVITLDDAKHCVDVIGSQPFVRQELRRLQHLKRRKKKPKK